MSDIFKFSVSALAVAAISGSLPTMAFAADPQMEYDTWYVSVFGGYNMARAHASFSTENFDIKLKDGFTVGIATGSYVADGVRMERELSYVRNKSERWDYWGHARDPQALVGHSSGVFLMNNIWKDIRLSDRFQPYIGGGIGAALLSGKGDSVFEDYDFSGELAFAMQAGVGARYAVTDRLALDVGYRYRAAMDAAYFGAKDGSSNGAFSFRNHTLQAGLTYAFQDNGVVMPTSQGDSGAYVSVFAGGVFPSKTAWDYGGAIYALNQKNGFTVGAAAGTQLAPGLRGEAEFSHVRTKLKSVEFDNGGPDPASGTLNQNYLLLNVWKDFSFGMLQPYIGGGIGVGLLDFDNGVADDRDLSGKRGIGIAGQFGFGARVPVSDALMIDMGYRFKAVVDGYMEGDDNDFDYNYDIATYNHILQAGATYTFGGAGYEPAPEMTNKYVSVFGGLAKTVDTHFIYNSSNYIADFKTGFTVGAAVGGSINEKLRGEIELSYVKGDVKQFADNGNTVEAGSGGDVNGYFLLTNLWRDVDLGGFKPYFGGGLGLALMDVDVNILGVDPNQDTTVALAAQVGAGLRFDLTDQLTLDAGYRMKGALAAFTNGTNGSDHTLASYYTHVGQVGVSWKF